ncbi:MAG: VTT domain-containing protein [Anaerolineales bacterium]|nr:VTT domain-containing protein [Anaerolineales bacterium]
MNKPVPDGRRKRLVRLILLLLFVVMGFAFAAFYSPAAFHEFLQKNEYLGVSACLAVYLLLGPTPIPSEPLTLLVLAWKGPVPAVVLATLGNTLAAVMEYCLGGTIADLAEFEKRKQALPFGLGRLPIHSPVFLLFGRMLPGYGSKIISVAGGAYRVPAGTYLWTSVLSNLIGAMTVVLFGMGLINLIR